MLNPNAAQDKERIAQLIASIRDMQQRPGSRLLTSNELKQREDRRHGMAVSLSIRGYESLPEYRNGSN